MFEDIREKIEQDIKNHIDGWIEWRAISKKNLDVCKGIATKDLETGTCEICVAINNCYFKNENGKIPKKHYNCKCKNVARSPNTMQNIIVDFPPDKIWAYLFVHPAKKDLIASMGYTIDDAQEVYDIIYKQAVEKYTKGDYKLARLNENGQRINILIDINGKSAKSNRKYKFNSGWMIRPHRKITNNTPFGGWAE